MPISVVINTYNASRYLKEVLDAVKDFDEIVVCDMESTDDTRTIADEAGCKVVIFPKRNYTICEPARNFAIRSASSEWVLVVDADELVTDELKNYLYSLTENGEDLAGLYVPRKNYMMGKFLKSSYPDYQLRFFKRDLVDWPPYVHARPEVKGRVEKIPSSNMSLALVHLGPSMKDVVNHANNYTDNEIIRRKPKKVGFVNFLTEPAFRFVKSYIFKGGIFLGKAGLIQAQMDAFYKYQTLAKMHERNVLNDLNSKKG